MLVPLANWHNPSKRRLEAIRAAHERDLNGLLELLEAYLILKGRKRATLSRRTLENYRLAVRDYLAWAWSDTQSLDILKASADDLDRYITHLQLHSAHERQRVAKRIVHSAHERQRVEQPEDPSTKERRVDRPTGERAAARRKADRPPGARAAASHEVDRPTGARTPASHEVDRPPGLKPGSIATYLAGVRALYRALEWADAARLPQVRSPSDPTPPEERRPALPEGLYKKLLQHLSGTDPQHVRDRLAIRLMAEAGLRISEVINLLVEDLSLAERLLLVRAGKGGKQRSVPLSKSLVQEIEGWLRLRLAHAAPGEQALLINLGGRKASGRAMTDKTLRKILNRHYRDLGFPDRYYGAHMLRHTAGTRFYKKSRDLHATARILGHSNINTSAIYAKMDLEGLFELVDGLDE